MDNDTENTDVRDLATDFMMYKIGKHSLKMFTHSSIQNKWNYLGGNFMTGIPPQRLTFI